MRHVFERLDLKKLELKKKVPRQQSPSADPNADPAEQEAWKKGG